MSDMLRYLGGAYFHPDYDLDHNSPDDVMRAFRRDEPADSSARLLEEIDGTLSTPKSETELKELWVEEADSYYDPQQDGLSYITWFGRMRDILTGRIE